MAGLTVGEYSGPNHPRDSTIDCCRLENSSVTVRFAGDVLTEIRTASVAGLLSIRRGGLEIGGVLFGTVHDNEVSVSAWRPLQIEYVNGPSFTLSSEDEASLKRLLDESTSDPDLSGLTPVGWFHSHTRSDVFLSPEDIAIHDRHFPNSKQIALVIRPFKFEPAQVALYARGIDMQLHGDAPGCRFEMAAKRRRPAMASDDVDVPVVPQVETTQAPPQPAAPPVVPVEPSFTVAAEPIPAVDHLPRKRTRAYLWIATAAAIVLCAAAGLFILNRPAQATASVPVHLNVRAAGGDLLIAWDGDSSPIRRARAASLTIVDGGQKNATVPLDTASLKRGTLTYARRSGDVVVRLQIAPDSGPVFEEVTRFIGPDPAPAPVQAVKDENSEAELSRIRAELERAKTELSKIQPENDRSRQLPAQPPSKSPPATRVFAFTTPAAPRPEMRLPDAVPQVQITKQSVPASVPPIATPASVAPPAPPVQQKTAAKPASGRAIWTGRLPKGSLLLVDPRRASVGTLTGHFPQRPARITVYPADLAQSGIVIYTAVARSSAVEPPSAANGWNLTTYNADPKRSRSITILEHPAEQNGWTPRLLVRSEEKNVSMLVIDWEELQ